MSQDTVEMYENLKVLPHAEKALELTNSILEYVENYGEQKYHGSLDNRAELAGIVAEKLGELFPERPIDTIRRMNPGVHLPTGAELAAELNKKPSA